MKKLFAYLLSYVFLGLSPLFAAEYEFKIHHFLSPKSALHAEALTPWANDIMKASDGRIKIEIFPSMTLGGTPTQLHRQVRDGVVDMAWIVNSYATGNFVRTEVFELPGVIQGNVSALNSAMLEMYQDGDLDDDFVGLFPLFQHVHGGQAMNMARDEIRKPDDLKGKKMRTPSRTGLWVLEALGASPIKTTVGEIPSALSKRVIDGALLPFEIMPSLKIEQQTKYHIEGPNGERLGTLAFQLAFNTKRWNSLPDDIKQIFLDHSGADWHVKIGKIWDFSENRAINIAKNRGNKHVQLTPAEWQKFDDAIQPVVQRWIDEMNTKDIDGKALYDKAVRLVKKHADK